MGAVGGRALVDAHAACCTPREEEGRGLGGQRIDHERFVSSRKVETVLSDRELLDDLGRWNVTETEA